MIRFTCPTCGADLKVRDDGAAGASIACPKCHAETTVPDAFQPAASPRRRKREYPIGQRIVLTVRYMAWSFLLLWTLGGIWWGQRAMAQQETLAAQAVEGIRAGLSLVTAYIVCRSIDALLMVRPPAPIVTEEDD